MNRLLRWITKLPRLIEFGIFYAKEVALSNLKVAYEVLTPNYGMKPGFIELDLKDMTDQQILFAANLITMTPGTLSLDVSNEMPHRLKVHGMYVGNPEEAVLELETQILRRVRNVF